MLFIYAEENIFQFYLIAVISMQTWKFMFKMMNTKIKCTTIIRCLALEK